MSNLTEAVSPVVINIKENLLILSDLFSSHTPTLMTICDDILFKDSHYFAIQHLGPKPTTAEHINSFILTTTSIYSGIFSQRNPLKINVKTNYSECCVVSFNQQQKIISVEFKIIVNKNFKQELINLRLNSRFEIINFTWKVIQGHKKIIEHDVNYKGFSAPDFIQLLRLKCNSNEQILELLPELLIPSAYNMQTDEFQDRLAVVDMILI